MRYILDATWVFPFARKKIVKPFSFSEGLFVLYIICWASGYKRRCRKANSVMEGVSTKVSQGTLHERNILKFT